MKRSIIAMLAVCTLLAAVPVFAGSEDVPPGSRIEGAPGSQLESAPPQLEGAPGSQVPPGQKDECLLYSKKCLQTAETIQQKMKKLDNEIRKGTRVYTPEELKRLEEKMQDLNKTLDTMMQNP